MKVEKQKVDVLLSKISLTKFAPSAGITVLGLLATATTVLQHADSGTEKISRP